MEKESRRSKAGRFLVMEAMKRVKKMGCREFFARIQEENVPFFRKLGWTPLGGPEACHGRPHRLMRADLGLVPDDLLPE